MSEPGNPARLRLFVALELPEEIKAELRTTQARLKTGFAGASVRWARDEQFHLTLKFLGDVETSWVDALTQAVCAACRPVAPLRLSAAGLGLFPERGRPRVLWVGVHDASNCLTSLQQSIETAAAPYSEEKAEGRFLAHITLARIKEIPHSQAVALRERVDAMQALRFGEWLATEVRVMRSELLSGGARHTCLASAALAGGTSSTALG